MNRLQLGIPIFVELVLFEDSSGNYGSADTFVVFHYRFADIAVIGNVRWVVADDDFGNPLPFRGSSQLGEQFGYGVIPVIMFRYLDGIEVPNFPDRGLRLVQVDIADMRSGFGECLDVGKSFHPAERQGLPNGTIAAYQPRIAVELGVGRSDQAYGFARFTPLPRLEKRSERIGKPFRLAGDHMLERSEISQGNEDLFLLFETGFYGAELLAQ